MLQINTYNQSFNDAWKQLKTYHKEIEVFPDEVAIDFSKMPRFKNETDWLQYFGNIHTILVIGYRNGWIRTHVDGRGFPVLILVNKSYFKQV